MADALGCVEAQETLIRADENHKQMTHLRTPVLVALFTLAHIVPAFAQSASVPDRLVPLAKGWTRIEKDTNGDGRVDCIMIVDAAGQTVEEQLDTNFDGKMDSFYYFQNGVLSQVELDTNFDGKIDLWVWLTKGLYVTRYERDADFDGKVDIVRDFEHPDQDESGKEIAAPPTPDVSIPSPLPAGGAP